MEATANRLRIAYSEVIAALKAGGRAEEARQSAELAVSHGVWAHPAQRPLLFVPSLPAKPIYDAERFWVAAYLEQHWRDIRAELDRVTDPRAAGFTPVEEPLLNCGSWEEVIFYEGGQRFPRAHSLFPVTSALLEEIPEELRSAGVVMFSRLGPHSHIVPHCGQTNARLRIHLGLRTPPGAGLRVHEQRLQWTEGRCLVFDDSFEHEVWHNGEEPRVVLLFDVFHPALPEAVKKDLLEVSRVSMERKAVRFMTDRGLRRIWRNSDGGGSFELNRETELLLGRYLTEANVREIRLSGDRVEVQPE